jgi:hypothetical protein
MYIFNGARFSKNALTTYCDNYVETMVKKHGFDTQKGTVQVEGKEMPVIIDFGWMSITKKLSADIAQGLVKSNDRFNRQAVLEWLDRYVELNTRQFKFDSGNGWAQVQNAGFLKQIAYANWVAARDLSGFLCED